jgi:DeoR/GlpR family transcriptional regulator of sugar metabolism
VSSDGDPRPLLGESRRRAITDLLRDAGAVTVADLQARFAISTMTARRDLAELERQGIARRTHGGAVLPLVSSQEDSFAQRIERNAPAKERLARAAVDLLAARATVFLDSSSTSYYVARRILEAGMPTTIITNCLAIMDMVGGQGHSQVELIGIGGTLRPPTRSFVGPYAVHAINGHFADRMFLSVKGVSSGGVLTDADPLEAEVKRAMIRQAAEPVLLIDETKLSNRGLNAIAPIEDLAGVIVDGGHGPVLAGLRAHGVAIRAIGS